MLKLEMTLPFLKGESKSENIYMKEFIPRMQVVECTFQRKKETKATRKGREEKTLTKEIVEVEEYNLRMWNVKWFSNLHLGEIALVSNLWCFKKSVKKYLISNTLTAISSSVVA